MSLIAKRGRCLHCGHDHDKPRFRTPVVGTPLINAAPELLSALRALVARNFTFKGGFVIDCNITEAEVFAAYAAITKATGEFKP